jgi:hypothetical protein
MLLPRMPMPVAQGRDSRLDSHAPTLSELTHSHSRALPKVSTGLFSNLLYVIPMSVAFPFCFPSSVVSDSRTAPSARARL